MHRTDRKKTPHPVKKRASKGDKGAEEAPALILKDGVYSLQSIARSMRSLR